MNKKSNFIDSVSIPGNLSREEENKIMVDIFNHCKKSTPKNLYRYRCCNNLNFEALANDQVVLTSPLLFNDPYDSLLYINRNSLLEKLKSPLDNENIAKKLVSNSEFRLQQEELFGEEYIHKIIDNPIHDEDYEEFKKRSLIFYSNFLDQLIAVSLKKLKQSSYIGCFSETYESILMWSHYAMNHTGFVLNYDFQSQFEIEITVGDKKHIGSHFIDKQIFPVHYSQNRYDATEYIELHMIDNFFNQIGIDYNIPFFDKLFYYKFLLKKSLNWKYEQEWRIIKLNPEFQDDEQPKFEVIDYVRPTDIYLGYEISNTDRKKLIDIAKRKNIKVHQAALDLFESKYKLSSMRIL